MEVGQLQFISGFEHVKPCMLGLHEKPLGAEQSPSYVEKASLMLHHLHHLHHYIK